MLDEMHQPAAEVVARAYVDAEGYAKMYADSIADPDAFWGEQGRRLDWIKPFTRVKNTSFDYHGVSIIGLTNLPSSVPVHASQLYARNVQALLTHLAPEGELNLDWEDEITAGACFTREAVRA